MQFGAPSIGENLDHEDHTGYALDHTSDYGKPGPHRGAHSAAGETRTLSCALPLSLFGQQQVAGKAVYFGPEGIKVRKNNPVALSFQMTLYLH